MPVSTPHPPRDDVTPDGDVGPSRAPDDVVTPQIVADHFHINVDTIRAHIKAGRLNATDVSLNPGSGKPRWRMFWSDVLDFAQRQSVTATREAQRQARAALRQQRFQRQQRKQAAGAGQK